MFLSYGRRKGQDVALGMIIKEAEREGQAVHIKPGDTAPIGYRQVSIMQGGGPFTNKWVSPVLHGFISEFTAYNHQSEILSTFGRFMAYTKVRQFSDPRFLLFYNIVIIFVKFKFK